MLTAQVAVQRGGRELGRLRRDRHRGEGLQGQFGGEDVPTAVAPDIDDQPCRRQQGTQPGNLGDEAAGIVDIEREDPQVTVLDAVDHDPARAEHARHG